MYHFAKCHQPTNTPKEAQVKMPNPNAERVFLASGLPDTERVRRAIIADAHYKLNHIPGIRFSDAVASACHNFPNLASPIALSILNRPDPEPDPDPEPQNPEPESRRNP